MATDAPSGTNSAIASRMERSFDICLTTLPFWLALFHKRLNAFLSVFGLHQFVEVNLFGPREALVEVHGVPRVIAFLVMPSAAGLSEESLPTASFTTCSNRSAATAPLASPVAAASEPVIERPVRTRSDARFCPIRALRAVMATGGKQPS